MTMNEKYCTRVAAAVAARERQRFRTPKYTMASNNAGTETTGVMWFPGPSC